MERHLDSASSPGFRADPGPAPSAPRRNWLHRLVNGAVAVVVLAVAAGTFFLSYPGVHAIALQGGVSGQLARFYPAVFDAVLVIACVAAVMLRDARWWARCWAWLVAIVVLAAIGLTDVLHAMNYGLRQRPTEGVVAAAPVVAVLLAFSLFLTMLRQSRPQASVRADDHAVEPPTAPMMFSPVGAVSVVAAGAVPRPPAPPIALPASPDDAPTADLPGDDVDEAPDGHGAVAQTPDTVPTQGLPAVAVAATDTGDTGQQAGPAAEDETAPTDSTDAADDTSDAESSNPESAQAPAEPATEQEPEAETVTEPATQPIRYASSAAAEQFGNEDWEAEVDPALAGQVYPVLSSDPDIEMPPHQPGQSQDLEDDAPPFATAPFASVPRLNRVRVTPTPPTDDAAVAEE